MPSVTELAAAQFSRLIPLLQTPAIVDVRIDHSRARNQRPDIHDTAVARHVPFVGALA